MENLLFTQLSIPEIKQLFRQEIKQELELYRINSKQDNFNSHRTKRWYDLQGISKYIPGEPALQTIYGWVGKNEIPFHKKGKRLYFLESEIDDWLKSGRKKTITEIAAEANSFLNSRKKGAKP